MQQRTGRRIPCAFSEADCSSGQGDASRAHSVSGLQQRIAAADRAAHPVRIRGLQQRTGRRIPCAFGEADCSSGQGGASRAHSVKRIAAADRAAHPMRIRLQQQTGQRIPYAFGCASAANSAKTKVLAYGPLTGCKTGLTKLTKAKNWAAQAQHWLHPNEIAQQNMVIEESRLIPKGSHWYNPDSHSGFSGHFFSWKTRCSLRPAVRYYYIDFGLSNHFPGGKESARIATTLRTFPMIPELSLTVPYNPFYVDVFQLGLAMSRIIEVYPALEDFRTVAASMTVDDPQARATLEEALKQLNCLWDQMPPSLRRKQIWPIAEPREQSSSFESCTGLVLGELC
ncbi:hypothetical protein K438DRAFT_1938270 [Mycena galopus ATCC 62051]|nr:hypothetical protein K438DRAFT_1938270 [Mycena galopus ATCC 62051]